MGRLPAGGVRMTELQHPKWTEGQDGGDTVNGANVITIGSSMGFGMHDRGFDKEPPMGFDKEPPQERDKDRRPMDGENFKPEDMPEETH